MTMMNFRLIYLSEATAPVSASDLRSILETSRRNNSARSITGVLIYLDRLFFQVLEGPESQVKAVYRTISQDQRHGNFRIVSTGPALSRAFPNWSMGYASPETLGAQAKDSVFAIRDLVPRDSQYRGDDPAVRHAVRRFLAQFDTLPT